MKFNLKMIAVAAAMVSAGVANAAPTTGGNNGSLVIAAYNTVSSAYYIRDTGLLINSFLPNRQVNWTLYVVKWIQINDFFLYHPNSHTLIN
jgi:hypothetical protein